jgi:enterobacteria phage integrase
MAVLGHKTLSEAERYTREADQGRLANEAMKKLEGRSANRIAQTEAIGLGGTSEKGEKSE